MSRLLLSSLTFASVLVAASGFAACSSSSVGAVASDAGQQVASDGGAQDTPIVGISPALLSAFRQGEADFYQAFGESDGLGPLYTKTSCGDCHGEAGRGPGAATKMVVVGADGLTPSADQSLLPYGNTEHPLVVTDIPGAHTPILPPFDGGIDGGAAGMESIRVTTRMGPPIFGLGYMEAIADSEIERMETEEASRTDGVHGHANRLPFVSSPNPDPTFDSHQTGDTVIGRFGLKARISTLDEFTADALQGDLGITSPMRTTEFANPDGITDDLKPGVDVTADKMNSRAMYVRLLAIPPRVDNAAGKSWFEQCKCQACHAESLHTRADYPIPQLADIEAPVYTDLLLHDMGDGLSDSVQGANEGQGGPREWRTLPLIGVRYLKAYLHDGRAATIADAIALHASNGSEANAAVQCYQTTLSVASRQLLVDFVNGL